ncbi:hypothetical protein B0T26DRAFT_753596 [Lasiosphaeria miniovina]|uniref:Uncharacterized protein n=1 Tax=Lasiosphaeria miniovina TaxID=1954250 RepID=A0AA40DU56_9PEZI|nr:uncharacterized protein B0T26DRAFT_753596 [Lasiosphaeria miniovina]KAK0713497.1 hypothetical protein B0T26DRAFT_753596 [Lasiosphaeria miniovina]
MAIAAFSAQDASQHLQASVTAMVMSLLGAPEATSATLRTKQPSSTSTTPTTSTTLATGTTSSSSKILSTSTPSSTRTSLITEYLHRTMEHHHQQNIDPQRAIEHQSSNLTADPNPFDYKIAFARFPVDGCTQ